MDKAEGHELSLKDRDFIRPAGENSSPSIDEENVNSISSSSFAAALRDKVSIVRKESAGDVMVRAPATPKQLAYCFLCCYSKSIAMTI